MWPRIFKNAAVIVLIYWVLTSYMRADGNLGEALMSRVDDALLVGGIYLAIMAGLEWFKGRKK